MDLVDIKSEAARLRERKGRGEQTRQPDERSRIEEQLELLKKRADRGAITPEEHEKERAKLLKQFLEVK